MQSLFGMMVTKSISAVAELGVPDALKDGSVYYTDLAEAVGADQRALHRVMRMLAAHMMRSRLVTRETAGARIHRYHHVPPGTETEPALVHRARLLAWSGDSRHRHW